MVIFLITARLFCSTNVLLEFDISNSRWRYWYWKRFHWIIWNHEHQNELCAWFAHYKILIWCPSSWWLNIQITNGQIQIRTSKAHYKRGIILIKYPLIQSKVLYLFIWHMERMDKANVFFYSYEVQVEAEGRRRGLGQQVLRVLEKLANATRMRYVRLTALTHNPAAAAFFRACG